MYKLIKEYPGSPKLGHIINDPNLGENWPEFYEKIEQDEPILISDDGVKLYQSDNFWFIDPYWNICRGWISSSFKRKPELERGLFSTKKAAEEFVAYNKTKYSQKDIDEMLFDKIK